MLKGWKNCIVVKVLVHAENWALFPSTYMVNHNSLTQIPGIQHHLLTSVGTAKHVVNIHAYRQNSHSIHIKQNALKAMR